MLEEFDLEAVYDEQIAPLMAQVIAICDQHNMAVIASFAYRRDSRGEFDLCTSSLGKPGRTPLEYVTFQKLLFPGE